MAWASLIVAVFAVLIAGGALGWTIKRDRKQEKALAKESAERKAADERAEKWKQSADIVAEFAGDVPSEAGGTIYKIKVRNVGQSTAREVSAAFAERVRDNRLSGPVTYFNRLGTLTPSDDWTDCTLSSPNPPRDDRARRPGAIVAYWIDGTGEQRDREIGRADIF